MNEIVAAYHATPIWRRYFELCKPRVVALIVFTALVGMFLSTPGMAPWDALLFGTLGIALASASGAALNHWIDQRIDAVMERTRSRPLPQGDLTPAYALGFAIGLGIIAMLILFLLVNTLTAVLTFLALIGYAVVYTVFLKRSTPQNIVLGGAAGAAPPLLGWTAVTGDVQSGALVLFLIIFVWTPPHFWSLAIKRRDEYARAGIPMLPVTHGIAATKRQILFYTLLLFVVTMLPVVIGMSGMLYMAGALVLGIGFIRHALRLYRARADEHAMQTFAYSIFYLSVLFGLLLADHYLRLLLRYLVG